jgi:thiosulfate/3-mercaptopyruvate sulfurtransferase
LRYRKIGFCFLFILLTVLLFGCQKDNSRPGRETEIDLSGYKNSDILITAQDLKQKLEDPNVLIFDASTPELYAKGHIPGAINVPWQKLSYVQGKPGDKNWGVSMNKEDLTRALEALGVDNSKTVVCYTDVLKGPGADGRLVWQMRMAGFKNAKLLAGGFNAWKNMGYEVTREPGKVTPATGLMLQDYDESYNATTEYIAANLGKVKLIDCRTKKEFEGDTSHGEARGGHIAGAIHLEWKKLLYSDGTPKKAEEIIALLEDQGFTPDDEFIIY